MLSLAIGEDLNLGLILRLENFINNTDEILPEDRYVGFS